MKKLISSLLVLSLAVLILSPGIPVMANSNLIPYSVSIPTQPVTDVITTEAQLELTAYIHHIIITNSDASIAQTVTFYKLGASTTTVTEEFSIDIASTDASVAFQPIQIPFPIGASPYVLEDMLVRKSSLSSDIKVTVWYR